MLFVAFFMSAEVNSYAFRRGDGFVSVGDSKAKVLLECGKPTLKEKIKVKKGGHYRTGEKGKDGNSDVKHTYLAKEKRKPVEKWYYNCGADDFIYILTFEGGILKSEETGGYGKGKSGCRGR